MHIQYTCTRYTHDSLMKSTIKIFPVEIILCGVTKVKFLFNFLGCYLPSDSKYYTHSHTHTHLHIPRETRYYIMVYRL